jgi:RNA polymerase sigma-70 factor (ECF subfamily)
MSAIVVRELLGQLKPAQVDAITLVKLQGFSVEEASRMTGQSASLIKINIHRGLAKARGCCQTTIGSRLPELRSQKVH